MFALPCRGPGASHALGLVSLLALVLVAPGARADIAPPDRCSGNEGAACNNAGPKYNSPGICAVDTCSRTLPPMNGGAPTVTTYTCMTCVLKPDGGAGSPEEKSDGCSYTPGSRGGAGSLGLGVGLFGLALWRLRSRRR